MSIIIDGMDQQYCRIPYLGTQSSFNKLLHQIIVGVKSHSDDRLTIYRCPHIVCKGANLSMYCILDQIDIWEKMYSITPQIIYLQLDGGSENANKWVLVLLELIVSKRLVNEVWFSRLPVGHTHEDIDACFGTIWKSFRNRPCLTLTAYKGVVEKSFKNSTLRVQFKDVLVIPDYQSVLDKSNCYDMKIGKLHKNELTQHQWRFEAVNRDQHFPFGVKVTFRAYSSDVVVELHRKSAIECLTEIGQTTGLEPVSVYSQWQPTCESIKDRNIEGFYLLRNRLPDWQSCFPLLNLFPPQRFPDHCREELAATIAEIQTRYSSYEDESIKNEWINWFELYGPRVHDVLQYVASSQSIRSRYSRPYCDFLFNSQAPVLNETRYNNFICYEIDYAT
jgi:hypothetical protein